MGYEGRLTQWNDERGFGFIEPVQGGDKVFVHISAFARSDRGPVGRPQLGDRVSFEVVTDVQGRKQARHVVRPDAVARAGVTDARRAPRPERARRPAEASSGLGSAVGWVAGVLLVAALGWQGYHWWQAYAPGRPREAATLAQPPAQRDPARPVEAAIAFRCDGRTMCSQMTSCAEAKYFLRNCPGTKMDGNHDGVPCEQQWCTSPWAK